jgi:DNA mismatch endonuclease, patch repair protein
VADILTKEKRSALMARIKGRGNLSTEMRLISLMRALRIRGWRRNQRLPGRPDFVFRRERVAVFVDGCFWHGCPIHYTKPASSHDFWQEKVSANRRRDRRVDRKLRSEGWTVVRIWEHDLKRATWEAALARFIALLRRRARGR